MRGRKAAAGIALTMAAWGCGGEAGPGPAASSGPRAEATVSGKVKVQGKVATKGRVVFEPLDARDMPTATHVAEIGKDGTYEAKTLSGKNSLNVSGTGVPAADVGYNRKDVELKPGANTIDLALPLDAENR